MSFDDRAKIVLDDLSVLHYFYYYIIPFRDYLAEILTDIITCYMSTCIIDLRCSKRSVFPIAALFGLVERIAQQSLG